MVKATSLWPSISEGFKAGGFLQSVEKLPFCRTFLSVGAVGLEPTLLVRIRILSPVRLPIPPRPREFGREYNS